MPLYEFACTKCHTVVSKIKSMSERTTRISCEEVDCDGLCDRIISATWGKVAGSSNPVYMTKGAHLGQIKLGADIDPDKPIKYFSTKTGMTITDHNKQEYKETCDDVTFKKQLSDKQKAETKS